MCLTSKSLPRTGSPAFPSHYILLKCVFFLLAWHIIYIICMSILCSPIGAPNFGTNVHTFTNPMISNPSIKKANSSTTHSVSVSHFQWRSGLSFKKVFSGCLPIADSGLQNTFCKGTPWDPYQTVGLRGQTHRLNNNLPIPTDRCDRPKSISS